MLGINSVKSSDPNTFKTVYFLFQDFFSILSFYGHVSISVSSPGQAIGFEFFIFLQKLRAFFKCAEEWFGKSLSISNECFKM